MFGNRISKMSTRVIRWRAVFGWVCVHVFTAASAPLFAAEPETAPGPTSALDTLVTHFGGDKSGSLGSDVTIFPSSKKEGEANPRPALEADARSAFQTFANDLHKRKGDAIFAGWKEIHSGEGANPNLPTILAAHSGFQVRLQAEQLFENRDDADAATEAVRSFFAAEEIGRHAVYFLSDKDVHSGLLLAAELKDGRRVFLIFLMD